MEVNGKYSIKMNCSNCGETEIRFYQKGTCCPTTDECSHCGCLTLSRDKALPHPSPFDQRKIC